MATDPQVPVIKPDPMLRPIRGATDESGDSGSVPVIKSDPTLKPIRGIADEKGYDHEVPVIKSMASLKAAQGQQDSAIPISDVTKGVPFRGGMFTDREVALIPSGG
jgi:hypothetical protein